MSVKEKKLDLVRDSSEYFHELITDAMKTKHIKADAHVEFYLVNLLTQYVRSDSLFGIDSNSGVHKQELLAEMYKEAVDSGSAHQQQKIFKKLGDVSLYTAGFFRESLSRKVVDVHYYIDMGSSAYHRVSALMRDADFSALFRELAQRFGLFAEVISMAKSASSGTNSIKNSMKDSMKDSMKNDKHGEFISDLSLQRSNVLIMPREKLSQKQCGSLDVLKKSGNRGRKKG